MSESPQSLDRHQVRVLVAANLRLDWRGAANPLGGHGSRRGRIPGLVVILAVNLIASIFFGVVFFKVADLFSGLVISATGALALVSIQVLLEFGNVIISPDDYQVIGPHPVTSKTFYVAKLTHMIIYVTLLSSSVSIVPAILAALAFGGFLAAPVVLVHFWVTNMFGAVFMMNLYTLILKKVDRQRLERWLGYLHMLLILSIYLGLNVLARVMGDFLTDLDVTTLPWMKLVPPYWFGSWARLATGPWDTETFALGLLGVALLIGLGNVAVSYLSLSYSESLARVGWRRGVPTRRELPQFVRRLRDRVFGYEDRALLALVRANFKHDIQFRIGIFGFVPLLLFYLIYGLVRAGSNVLDPLAPTSDASATTNTLFGIAVVISPYILLPSLQVSKSWQAAWVFHATPIDRLKMVMAMTRVATVTMILPLSIILGVVFTLLYGNLLHGVLHTVYMVTLALTGLSLLNLFSIRLPFAMESRPGTVTGGTLGPMFLAMLVFGVPIGIIGHLGYGGYAGWAIIMAATLAIRWMLGRRQCNRVRKVAPTWEFFG